MIAALNEFIECLFPRSDSALGNIILSPVAMDLNMVVILVRRSNKCKEKRDDVSLFVPLIRRR